MDATLWIVGRQKLPQGKDYFRNTGWMFLKKFAAENGEYCTAGTQFQISSMRRGRESDIQRHFLKKSLARRYREQAHILDLSSSGN